MQLLETMLWGLSLKSTYVLPGGGTSVCMENSEKGMTVHHPCGCMRQVSIVFLLQIQRSASLTTSQVVTIRLNSNTLISSFSCWGKTLHLSTILVLTLIKSSCKIYFYLLGFHYEAYDILPQALFSLATLFISDHFNVNCWVCIHIMFQFQRNIMVVFFKATN